MKNFFTHKMRGKSPIEIVAMVVFGIIFVTGLAILLGYVIMWLWNWLMAGVFGLPALTYWQAVGLFILAKVLLGGCGSGGSGKSSKKSDKKCDNTSKSDFSKWKYYDKFWEEEGDELYKQYLERKVNQAQNKENETETKPESESE